MTSFRAILAVLGVLMLRTFIATSLTDVSAQFTDLLSKTAVCLHGLNGKRTDIGTFSVQTNALRHHLDVVFFEAIIKTPIALFHAF